MVFPIQNLQETQMHTITVHFQFLPIIQYPLDRYEASKLNKSDFVKYSRT